MAKTSAAKRTDAATTQIEASFPSKYQAKVQKSRPKPVAVVSNYGLRSKGRQTMAAKVSAPKAPFPSLSPAVVSPANSIGASKSSSEAGKACKSSRATSMTAEEDWEITQAALILLAMSKEALKGKGF